MRRTIRSKHTVRFMRCRSGLDAFLRAMGALSLREALVRANHALGEICMLKQPQQNTQFLSDFLFNEQKYKGLEKGLTGCC